MTSSREESLSRPRILVPEETKHLILQLRAQGKTLKQIASQTGLRYNLVQRVLSNHHSRTVPSSGLGTKTPIPDIPASSPQSLQTLRQKANRLNGAARNYSDSSPPSVSRMLQSQEPESEKTKRLRAELEEAKLSRQILEETKAKYSLQEEFLKMVAPKQEDRTFQLPPGITLYEYSEDRYHEIETYEFNFAMAYYKGDIDAIHRFYLSRQWYWMVWSLKEIKTSPENVNPNPSKGGQPERNTPNRLISGALK